MYIHINEKALVTWYDIQGRRLTFFSGGGGGGCTGQRLPTKLATITDKNKCPNTNLTL